MATNIPLSKVKQRIAAIQGEMKSLEAELLDLQAALRVADRLNGVVQKPIESEGIPTLYTQPWSAKSAHDSIANNVQTYLDNYQTFPSLVLTILQSGPKTRGEIIDAVKAVKPEIASTVFSSSLARMAARKQIMREGDDSFRLPTPAEHLSIIGSNVADSDSAL